MAINFDPPPRCSTVTVHFPIFFLPSRGLIEQQGFLCLHPVRIMCAFPDGAFRKSLLDLYFTLDKFQMEFPYWLMMATTTCENISSTTNLAAAVYESNIKEEIPSIDFTLLMRGNIEERSKIVEEINRACKEWGCFTVLNHDVPESLTKTTLETVSGFFEQTAEEKKVYMNGLFDPIRYGCHLEHGREFFRLFVHPPIDFPTKFVNLGEISKEYARHIRKIHTELLRALWESLGLSVSSIEETLHLKSCSQVLMNNIYCPSAQQEVSLGFVSHTDNSFLTILMQNKTMAGLQVMHHGKWIPVEYVPNSFFVHTGDYLEIISNGIFKSVLHRVMNKDKIKRISIVSIIGTSLETVVAPLPQLVDISNRPVTFRAITFKESVELKQRYFQEKCFLDHIKL